MLFTREPYNQQSTQRYISIIFRSSHDCIKDSGAVMHVHFTEKVKFTQYKHPNNLKHTGD